MIDCIMRWISIFPAAVALFGQAAQAQVQTVPTPAGAERVVFRNTLTPAEKQFIAAAPALQIDRRELFDAVRRDKLYWGEADLDGDGKPERILVNTRSDVCGTGGCSTRVLTGPRGKWRVIGTVPLFVSYVVVLPTSDYGWRRFQSAGIEIFWTGCEYDGGGTEHELAEWPPDPCPRIHYGEGLLAKEKKRSEK